MVDATGTRFNLTVTAGLREVRVLELAKLGEPMDLSNSVWRGHVIDAAGATREIACEHGAGAGELLLTFPALEGGVYRWELATGTEAGDVMRAMYGEVTAVSSKAADLLLQEVAEANLCKIHVEVPKEVGVAWQIGWKASTIAGAKASQVSITAEQLTELAQRVEAACGMAETALGKLTSLDDLLAAFYAEFYKQVSIDDETKCWIIGGHLTTAKAVGEPGKSPRLSTSLTWLTWDEGLQDWKDEGISAVGKDGHSPYIGALGTWIEWRDGAWVDTGCRAQGKDGINGATVRRILVNSYEDIPQEGATCNGGFYYYVRTDNGYDRYEWVEQLDGSASWVRTGETNDIARSDVYGIVKTATDATVNGGAPVGNNAAGQLSVPLAEPTVPGVALPSCWDYLENETSGAVGRTEDGRLRAESATSNRFGTVRVSRPEVVECSNVGLDENGNLATTWATVETGGSVKLSTNDTIAHGGIIGRNAEGQLVLRPAGYRQYGAVCFGTESRITLNDAPHVITIAQCDGDNSFNQWAGNILNSMSVNLAQKGVLRYDSEGPNGENTGNSLWLAHDETLTTTEDGRLSIKGHFVTETYAEATYLKINDAKQQYLASSENLTGFAVVTESEYAELESQGRVLPKVEYQIVADEA